MTRNPLHLFSTDDEPSQRGLVPTLPPMHDPAHRDQVRSILATTLGMDELDLQADVSQETCQRWNSLRHMMLIASLEDEFGVQFTTAEILEMTSQPAILAVLERRGAVVGA